MIPDVRTMPVAAALLIACVAVQVLILVRMGYHSRSTQHALRLMPLLFIVSGVSAVAAIWLMFDFGMALRAGGILAVAGVGLSISLRYGVAPEGPTA